MDTTPVFREGHEAEEIVPGVPIIRGNTPRPSSFDTMISSLQKFQRSSPVETKNGDPQSAPVTQRVMAQERGQRWLTAFSLYLVGLLLILLLFAVVEGIGVGQDALASGFAPLGVPWQVLIYGLLGGCISCIVSLSNIRVYNSPLFVMITWFTRPFIGSILALFSYILLTSGLFVLSETVVQHPGFFWLIGSLAGLSEWWLFCRRKGSNP